ncbi:conserved hypothetical protein [Halanaerobium saccharolyticum subsp. saccharolyticum DSM 6643]|uniref:Uncharacterized protein n=1 Tax=Halanaerobium saccharolyticum subsp. saccharolyticum DSM 6643 TaxID=1293054 RepID=M5E130_9FIRM|nr:hypothetical protein [Halanaerobium saccharolyticum]CCU79469.1 conserved hypothetical protein [Halanaerobium saccharolyticum subsp. saccharolyticum DSM 6643]
MGLFDKLKSVFTSDGPNQSKLIDIYVEDDKCGNQMKLLFRKSYDIQKVYKDDREAAYEIKKVVVCDNCYNKIDLHLKFDKRYKIIRQEIENGKIISKEEYEN